MGRIYLTDDSDEFIDFTLSRPGGTPQDVLVAYVHGFASHQGGEKILYFRERFLEKGCSFLAFDHRGHGRSSGEMKSLTITKNLEDLSAVLASEVGRYKKRILIGSSMGGHTAAWYSVGNPESVFANILLAPGFRFLENRRRELGPKGMKDLELKGQVTIQNNWVTATVGQELFEDARHYPFEKLISQYRAPTLIIHGLSDDTVPFEDSVRFASKSTARPLELLLISGGDHRLTHHKEALFSAIWGFCQRMGIEG